MNIDIDMLITIIKNSIDYTEDEIEFLVLNILNIEKAFKNKYQKELVFEIYSL